MEQGFITLPTANPLSIRAKAYVFEDVASQKLLQKVKQIAPSGASALVIGETGTGKELIARELHLQSNRSKKPFIPVNCGAFPENLVESELFGHEKGAFTGALLGKQGWFEVANGGTLFLDEIADLPIHLQVKLLRALQEKQIVRLGSRKHIDVDVRIVAATNVNLEDAVAAGRFREDLYYRLNVATLYIPPLRERRGDILPLAHHFLKSYVRKLNLKQMELSDDAMHALKNEYFWPGNIRELENVIHQALLVCQGRTISRDDLNLSSKLKRSVAKPVHHAKEENVADQNNGETELIKALHLLFEEGHRNVYELIEELVMRTAYQYSHQNQLETARLLGISRNIVRARLIKSSDLNPKVRARQNSKV